MFVLVLAAGAWLCVMSADAFGAMAFGGSFQSWLHERLGLPYDQRNAVVVGLAMGFAVIPIIFAIAEDAFSNVPRNLPSGSFALGATRWQTVTRLVLPTASPGIFSAIMVGFGRAIGETMIVVMATGNTPILDWNPFNGFRTLSANIAVEIPEAPHGGTLYRTLFLAALLLFVLTFAVNTMAELIRQRLRRRYAEL
jgi:phosphate transport system permease protein